MVAQSAPLSVNAQCRPQRIFLLGAAPKLSEAQFAEGTLGSTQGKCAAYLRATGQNTGNQVIAYGLLKTLKYESVSWDTGIGAERVNSEYDLILIAAANFLHTGFDFSGMTSFIEATNLPCVMVGVGAQSNDYSTNIALQPGTDRLMRVVAERSGLIGARGPFTAAVLAKMGIHNVQVTGCPSYYMSCKPTFEITKHQLDMNSRMLVNSSRDVVSHSFDREKMIDIVCGLIETAMVRNSDFVAQSELPEICIAESSDLAEKELFLNEILKNFPAYLRLGSYAELLRWFGEHMRVFWDVPLWLEQMKAYQFVYGNRFHGSMIALQAGTPACVICHDTRTSEMCDFLKLPFVCLKNIERVDIDSLYEMVDPVSIQTRYSQLYPQFKKFLLLNGLIPSLD